MREIPVVVVNGFLEAGKSSFINEVALENTFGSGVNTLIISCEEGEVEYDERLVNSGKVQILTIDSEEDISISQIRSIATTLKPEMVLVECNAMWEENILDYLPQNFRLYQICTIIDATTFEPYFANMRQKFLDMVIDSDLVVINRCEDDPKTANFKRSLKIINNNATYLLYDLDDQELHLESDLPYDVNTPIIRVKDEDYGVFYIDMFDSHARYDGKTVELNTMVMTSPKLPPNTFVAGRMALTCCADDMQYIGHLAVHRPGEKVRNNTWAHITAIVHYVYNEGAGEEEPVYEVIDMFEIPTIKEPVVSLN